MRLRAGGRVGREGVADEVSGDGGAMGEGSHFFVVGRRKVSLADDAGLFWTDVVGCVRRRVHGCVGLLGVGGVRHGVRGWASLVVRIVLRVLGGR